jgi:hypothetical protein
MWLPVERSWDTYGLVERAERWVLLAVSLACVSCGLGLDALRPRAAFDLRCPEAELEIVAFPGDAAGVSGCGRRASFRQTCAVGAFGARERCAWLLQSAIVDEEAPSPSATPVTGWRGRGDSIAGPLSNTAE